MTTHVCIAKPLMPDRWKSTPDTSFVAETSLLYLLSRVVHLFAGLHLDAGYCLNKRLDIVSLT